MSALNNLPDIDFVTTDVETLLASMIAEYEQAYYQQTGESKTLQPGDPVRIWIYSQALRILQAYQLIDYSAKQNLLKYSAGDYLDNLGARYGSKGTRLPAAKAVATIRYTLSTVQAETVTIPAGNRSSPGDNIFFTTLVVAQITAGQTYVDVAAESMEAGAAGNGYTAGQINILVDPIPYVASVANTDTSQGGSDVEEDAEYRERLFLLPESFSVAGPSGAYKYFCTQYSSAIQDVKVTSPNPGEVQVFFILTGGELPDSTLIAEVLSYLSDKTRRPLTDQVTVQAPTTVSYDINLTYYIRQADSAYVTTIQAAVNAAVTDFVAWQKSKIGRDINPSELISRIIQAGAKRVAITSPVYTDILDTQLAVADTVTVTYGGLENE